MTTHTLYINIGTNSGDRRAMIAQAVAAIVSCPLFAGATVRRSATVESEPGGFLSENRFLNVGLAVECVIDTSQLLCTPCSTHYRPSNEAYRRCRTATPTAPTATAASTSTS